MKKIPFKIRETISIILFLYAIGTIIASISLFIQFGLLVVIIIGPIFAFISFVISIIFMPTTKKEDINTEENNNNHKNIKVNKNRYKNSNKKDKEPFISDKEWKEQEEENDEMIFIEEILEDD